MTFIFREEQRKFPTLWMKSGRFCNLRKYGLKVVKNNTLVLLTENKRMKWLYKCYLFFSIVDKSLQLWRLYWVSLWDVDWTRPVATEREQCYSLLPAWCVNSLIPSIKASEWKWRFHGRQNTYKLPLYQTLSDFITNPVIDVLIVWSDSSKKLIKRIWGLWGKWQNLSKYSSL